MIVRQEGKEGSFLFFLSFNSSFFLSIKKCEHRGKERKSEKVLLFPGVTHVAASPAVTYIRSWLCIIYHPDFFWAFTHTRMHTHTCTHAHTHVCDARSFTFLCSDINGIVLTISLCMFSLEMHIQTFSHADMQEHPR